MNELSKRIERHLIDVSDWVSSSELCSIFQITERQLRATNTQHGLCSGFAISGNSGFKHVTLASKTEWIRFKHRLRKHGIAELVRVRNLGRVRRDVLKDYRSHQYEKDTGQRVMAL